MPTEKTRLLTDVEPIDQLNTYSTTNFISPKKDSSNKTEGKQGYVNKSVVINVDDEKKKVNKENIKNEVEENKSMTLLEKALAYRKQNPEKWEERKKENQSRLNHSLGLFEKNSFLEDYYEKLTEEEKKLQEKVPKKATLSFQLEFNNPRITHGKHKLHPEETYASISSNGISVFDKEESFFDRFRSSRDEERGIEPELLITIIKGRNFNKTLKDPDVAFKECRVKCKLYPDCHHHGPKMRSDYVDCNYKGNTKWQHVFVMKGFTAEELATRHVVLTIVGKTGSEKLTISELILAGNKANISHNNSTPARKSYPSESNPWQEALSKPGSTINVMSELCSEETEDSKEE